MGSMRAARVPSQNGGRVCWSGFILERIRKLWAASNMPKALIASKTSNEPSSLHQRGDACAQETNRTDNLPSTIWHILAPSTRKGGTHLRPHQQALLQQTRFSAAGGPSTSNMPGSTQAHPREKMGRAPYHAIPFDALANMTPRTRR